MAIGSMEIRSLTRRYQQSQADLLFLQYAQLNYKIILRHLICQPPVLMIISWKLLDVNVMWSEGDKGAFHDARSSCPEFVKIWYAAASITKKLSLLLVFLLSPIQIKFIFPFFLSFFGNFFSCKVDIYIYIVCLEGMGESNVLEYISCIRQCVVQQNLGIHPHPS